MVFSKKKNKKGGADLDAIQNQLNEMTAQVADIQIQVNALKNSNSSSNSNPISNPVSEPVQQPTTVKNWQTDKTIKFTDGRNGRVTLSFDRIMYLINSNINNNNTTKNWSDIKNELNNANSQDEVQNIIKKYQIGFASNYVVGGTRKKRKNNKKRTSRKR